MSFGGCLTGHVRITHATSVLRRLLGTTVCRTSTGGETSHAPKATSTMEPTKNFGGMLESSIARREGSSDPWGDVSEVRGCSSNFYLCPCGIMQEQFATSSRRPERARHSFPASSRLFTWKKRRGC